MSLTINASENHTTLSLNEAGQVCREEIASLFPQGHKSLSEITGEEADQFLKKIGKIAASYKSGQSKACLNDFLNLGIAKYSLFSAEELLSSLWKPPTREEITPIEGNVSFEESRKNNFSDAVELIELAQECLGKIKFNSSNSELGREANLLVSLIIGWGKDYKIEVKIGNPLPKKNRPAEMVL